jgi:hypothetical protein
VALDRRERLADALLHRSEDACREPVLGPEPVLLGLSEAAPRAAKDAAQHDGARSQRVALADKVLPYPAVPRGAPDRHGRTILAGIPCRQHVHQGFAGLQQTAPVLLDDLQMGHQTSGLGGIQKTRTFVQREELADAQRVDLKLLAVGEQPRGIDCFARHNRR